jgi:hypothetical protein
MEYMKLGYPNNFRFIFRLQSTTLLEFRNTDDLTSCCIQISHHIFPSAISPNSSPTDMHHLAFHPIPNVHSPSSHHKSTHYTPRRKASHASASASREHGHNTATSAPPSNNTPKSTSELTSCHLYRYIQ